MPVRSRTGRPLPRPSSEADAPHEDRGAGCPRHGRASRPGLSRAPAARVTTCVMQATECPRGDRGPVAPGQRAVPAPSHRPRRRRAGVPTPTVVRRPSVDVRSSPVTSSGHRLVAPHTEAVLVRVPPSGPMLWPVVSTRLGSGRSRRPPGRRLADASRGRALAGELQLPCRDDRVPPPGGLVARTNLQPRCWHRAGATLLVPNRSRPSGPGHPMLLARWPDVTGPPAVSPGFPGQPRSAQSPALVTAWSSPVVRALAASAPSDPVPRPACLAVTGHPARRPARPGHSGDQPPAPPRRCPRDAVCGLLARLPRTGSAVVRPLAVRPPRATGFRVAGPSLSRPYAFTRWRWRAIVKSTSRGGPPTSRGGQGGP